MSKIIKKSELFLTYPRLITIFGSGGEAKSKLGVHSQLEVAMPPVNGQIRDESEEILAETEQIVIELLEKARLEAQKIIGGAREEAETIKLKAREEAQLIQEEASREGYSKGREQARIEIESEMQQAQAEKQAIIRDAHSTRMELLSSAEKDMVELIILISKKVIACEISINPEAIIAVVRAAISYFNNSEKVLIHVNPKDLEVVVNALANENLPGMVNSKELYETRANSEISRGGCIVDNGNGSVDASLETRIEKVEGAIREVINEGES